MSEAEERRSLSEMDQASSEKHTHLGGFVGAIVPFQTLGVGARVDIYLLSSRLRLSSFVSLGVTYDRQDELRFAPFAEVGLGASLLRWLRPAGSLWSLPSAHSFEVEAGMLSGIGELYRCTANCADPNFEPRVEDASRFLTAPFVGVRYVHFTFARAGQGTLRPIQRFQVGIDALLPPIARLTPNLLNKHNEPITLRTLGGRVELKAPAIACLGACMGVAFGLGYYPAPGDVYLLLSLLGG